MAKRSKLSEISVCVETADNLLQDITTLHPHHSTYTVEQAVSKQREYCTAKSLKSDVSAAEMAVYTS